MRGKKNTYVMFWRPHEGNGILSQWYDSTFTVEGVEYSHAEMYMMAEKCKLMGDEETRQQILQCRHDPSKQQKLGRMVANWDEDLWLANREEVVYQASLAKFSQNSDLKAFLMQTDDAVLVEASPSDRVWGIGMKRTDYNATNEREWRGQNLLGKCLMRARETIRQEEEKAQAAAKLEQKSQRNAAEPRPGQPIPKNAASKAKQPAT